MKNRDYEPVDFSAEYNLPERIPPTLKDDRSYFGAGGDPTLKYRGKPHETDDGSAAKKHARLRKFFLWPVASTIAAATIIFSSFGIDPLGDDFLVRGWDEWDHLIHYDDEPALSAPDSIELYAGEERDLGAWVNRSAVSVIYECSDESVAVIDESGLVKGRRPGSAVIKVTSPELGQSSEVSITVTEAPFIEMPSSVTLSLGQTAELGARVVGYRVSDFPDGDPTLVYEYSGGSVASVTQQGTVTATGYGYVVITVRCPALGLESTVTVTVSASGLHLSADKLRMYGNSSASLDLILLDGDENPVDVALSFESTEPEIMTVEPDGTVIIGDDPGEHVIRVRCGAPEFESAVTVTVIRPEIDINEKTSAILGDEWDLTPYIVETVGENESPSFTFTSDNPGLISVSPDGHVTALGDGGAAVITVSSDYPPVSREITVTVERHEHVYGEWTVLSAATCTEAGSHEHVCEICGETEIEEIPAAGHTEVEDRAVAATCTASGKTAGSHCSVCGEVLTAQTTVAALGHNYLTEGAYCSRCGDSLVTIQIVTHSSFDTVDTGVTTTLSPTGVGSKPSNPIEVVVETEFELKYSFNVSGVDTGAVVWIYEPEYDITGEPIEKIGFDFVPDEQMCYCSAWGQTEDDPPSHMYMTFRYNGKLYTVNKYFRITDDNP
ncbi:MAG: hypothetical protein IJU75_01815 [Clostridia bacterium]|nr:hypothetical protein [Clostridia bacterium]